MKWDPLPPESEADKAVGTRLRQVKSPLPVFLRSREVSGATHEDIIRGMEILTSGKIIGRFFHMYPTVPSNLFQWMKTWMEMGGILVASLNLQQGVPEGIPLPDAWHHQMIYGVIESGVFVLNPHEFIPFPTLTKQLCSESVIKIRSKDITKRWSSGLDLSSISEGRWAELNVIENIHRLVQCVANNQLHDSHVTIPAAYKSGITVFCTRDSGAGRTLLEKQ